MNLEEELMKDPLVKEPIKVINTDYQDGKLIFTLNQQPSNNWTEIFISGKYSRSEIVGYGPNRFQFNGNTAQIYILEYFQQYRELAQNLKDYINETNNAYRQEKTQEVSHKIREEQERQRKLFAEEERRQKITEQIKGIF